MPVYGFPNSEVPGSSAAVAARRDFLCHRFPSRSILDCVSHPPDLLDSLTSDDRWLRRMARQLVRDASLADDLVQETWVAALRQGREAGRGWLATVLRNAAAQWRRSDSARERRELAVAPAEASADPAASIVDRLATQRRVLDAVLTLPEAARTVVLLRFYEDLPPREIARRLGEPVASVKSRLHRALERLRAELDARHGGSRAGWMLALAPFANPAPAAILGAGGTVMAVSTKWVAGAAFVLVLAGGGWWLAQDDGVEPVSTPIAVRDVRADDESMPEPTRDPGSTSPQSDSVRKSVAPTDVAPSPIAEPDHARVRGRVFDAAGSPRSGVRVKFTPMTSKNAATPTATSDVTGRFELGLTIALGSVAVDDERFVTLYAPAVDGPFTGEAVVVIADAVAMSGLVVDDNGAPIAGATIDFEFSRRVAAAIPVPLDGSVGRSFETRSDASGRFARAAVPLVPGIKIVASATGHASVTQSVPERGPLDLRFVLPRLESQPGSLAGQVVDRFSIPIEGARIAFLGEEATSGVDGRFRIDAQAVEANRNRLEVEMWVAKTGLLPKRLAFEPRRLPPFVTVELDGATRTIEGRVLDEDGKPAKDIAISIVDGTPFGQWDQQPAFAEEVAGDKHDAVTTGADGGFVVRGLMDRTYVLQAFDPVTRLRIHTAPIAADSKDVTIALPADAFVDGVRGRVVAPDGTPLVKASVYVQVTTRSIQVYAYGSEEHAASKPVSTDAEGRFTLDHVQRGPLQLAVDGDAVIRTSAVVGTVGDRNDEFTIVVSRRCHLRAELTGHRIRARWMSVLNAAGEVLPLGEVRGSGASWSDSQMLHEGRSAVFVVAEGATTVRIRFPDESTEDLPLKLVPGEVVVVSG